MAELAYSYTYHCWIVGTIDKTIGKFTNYRDAVRARDDYNELHAKDK